MRKYILYLVIFFGFAVIGGYIKSTYWVTTNKMSDSLNQANVQINQFSMKNNVHMKQEKYIELAVNLKINALEQGALLIQQILNYSRFFLTYHQAAMN